MFLLIEGDVSVVVYFLFLGGILEQILVELVLFEDNFYFDVFFVPFKALFDIPLFKLLLYLLFQDLFFPLQNLFLSEFPHLVLLLPLFKFCHVCLKSRVKTRLILLNWKMRVFFSFEIRLSLLYGTLNVVLFHELFLILIGKLGVLFYLELFLRPIGSSWEFRCVSLIGLFWCYIVLISWSLLDQLIPRLNFWQMEGRFCFVSGIAFRFLSILIRLLYSLFNILEVTKDFLYAFMSNAQSILDLNFYVHNEIFDFLIQLFVSSLNQWDDKVYYFGSFLCLESFLIVKLFLML